MKHFCNSQQHFTGLSNADLNQKVKPNNGTRNDSGNLAVDFSANSRMPGYPETNHIEVRKWGGEVYCFAIIIALQLALHQITACDPEPESGREKCNLFRKM